MAVSKELLERYKQLKAQGMNVSLAELKKQMEEESSSQSSNEQTPVQPSYSQPVMQTSQLEPAQTVWHPETSTNSSFGQVSNLQSHAQSQFDLQPQPLPQTQPLVQPQMQSYLQDQNNLYSQPQAQVYVQPEPVVQTPVQRYTGNVSVTQSQPGVLEPTSVTPKYTGNVNQIPQPQPQTSRKYALIGFPLGHSLSAYIHEAGFKSLGLDSTYEILETSPEDLVDRIKYMKFNNYAGFNVTIPLKLPVTLFLDAIDSSADVVGAVNTVTIDPETKAMTGYNTDVIGFRNAIPNDVVLAGKSCGVMGTGGAARAAITALCQEQVKSIKIFTRNIINSMELLEFLRKRFPNVEFNSYQIELIHDLSDIDFLVNATPIGMQGRSVSMTPVEEAEITTLPKGAIVYDVIYNPRKTVLLRLAERHGYRTITGMDMLIHQAVEAEKIWTGGVPDFKDMKIAALENV